MRCRFCSCKSKVPKSWSRLIEQLLSMLLLKRLKSIISHWPLTNRIEPGHSTMICLKHYHLSTLKVQTWFSKTSSSCKIPNRTVEMLVLSRSVSRASDCRIRLCDRAKTKFLAMPLVLSSLLTIAHLRKTLKWYLALVNSCAWPRDPSNSSCVTVSTHGKRAPTQTSKKVTNRWCRVRSTAVMMQTIAEVRKEKLSMSSR